jgi:hypothetical protein
MFILELYFLVYRVPKMMTRLAREHGQSALRWSLLGIGAWLAAEFGVLITAGVIYALGVEILDWPMPIHPGYKGLAYLLSLIAALLSPTLVARILTRKSKQEFSAPPPPPEFPQESPHAN